MSAAGQTHGLIDPCDHLLVFVVRADGEPGLFVADGVTSDQAAQLLQMMAGAVRTDPRFNPVS